MASATQLAGNWRNFDSFVWHRAADLPDAERWMIWYTSSPQSGLIEESNQAVMAARLARFAEGDDPNLVFEEHSHWLVSPLSGFSLRVCRANGTATDAFGAFCSLQQALADYPILDEEDYCDREYAATLDNYRNEMFAQKDNLPDGWAGQVYDYFLGCGRDDLVENCDDRGGFAPREKITDALRHLGLLPSVAAGP